MSGHAGSQDELSPSAGAGLPLFSVRDFETYAGPNRIFIEGVRPEMETGNPSLLFIGGAFDGSWICRQQLDYWASRGWPAYALNLRGYYKSRCHEVASLNHWDYLDDILAARNHLKLNCVIYVGYSMGGVLAQKAAELYGAHALVLYDSDPPRQVAEIAGAQPGKAVDTRPVLDFWPSRKIVEEMSGGPVSEEEYAGILENFKQSFLSGRAYRELEVEHIEVDAEAIDCPVLMVGVSSDDRVQAALADYYGASLFVFDGYSHGSILFGRNHAPVTRRVTEWLAAGFPRGLRETRRLEGILPAECGRKTRLLYFSGWEAPEVRLCTRRGRELRRVPMRRSGEGLFEADIRMDAGEQFYLSFADKEDRPPGRGHYEPSCSEIYLAGGEFFPRVPPGERSAPRYLTRMVHSPALGHTFTVNIMLPRDCGRGEGGPYPVMVLNDGQNQWKDQGAYGGWHTDASAVDRARRGRCRDIVLVAVFSPPDRDAAYLPPPRGVAPRYIDFIADTVLPELRKEFPITREPGETGFIGASYAANCVIFAGLSRPDTFGLVGSFSYPRVPDDPVLERMRSLDSLPMVRLYADCGTRWAYDQPHFDDFTGITRKIIGIARQKGMVPGETLLGIVAEGHFHNEVFWRQRVGRCLEFLYPLA